jgi:hypothetical protein
MASLKEVPLSGVMVQRPSLGFRAGTDYRVSSFDWQGRT